MTTTTDKELLEQAAKAAGLIHWVENKWNPLESDSDALRLAVKLNFELDIGRNYVSVVNWDGNKTSVDSNIEACIYKATRFAIVRAAAEVGKNYG